jgi:hypothetical protein
VDAETARATSTTVLWLTVVSGVACLVITVALAWNRPA